MVIAAGTPEEVAAERASHTGRFLAEILAPAAAPRKAKAAPRKPRAKVAA
jgi:excinuclease ABC subunit A